MCNFSVLKILWLVNSAQVENDIFLHQDLFFYGVGISCVPNELQGIINKNYISDVNKSGS